MPVCFQLYDKTKPGEPPVVLTEIDRLMCEHFEHPCDPVKYLNGWYDCIGFRLALGRSFEQIREQFNEYIVEDTAKGNPNHQVEYYQNSLLILAWLEEHYTTSSYYAPKALLEGY